MMFYLKQSKCFAFILWMIFAVMQFDIIVHEKTHLTDQHDCVKCQIFNQNLNVNITTDRVDFLINQISYYAPYFLYLKTELTVLFDVLSRAPPA